MRAPSPSGSHALAPAGFALAAGLIGALTLVRLIGLRLSVVDLFFDEAQYWDWSRDLAFGYFSKPPLLAWIIAASDAVCGSGEACVRSAAPLVYLGTALVAYAVARELYDAKVAFWSALVLALATGVAFSARIISTDVPLLFFWALALLAYVKLVRAPDRGWAVVLGVAFGLGLLAKYAMAYFLLGMALAAWFDADARAMLRRPQTWAALALGALILAPNIVWNIGHGLVTFRHTGDNIEGEGLGFTPLKALEFLAGQFAVFGPLLFGGLIALLARPSRRWPRPDRLLAAFVLAPLGLVTAVAIVRGANANWAAPAFVAAAVLVTAVWVREGRWALVYASLAIGLVAQGALLVGDAMADRVTVPGWGASGDLYRRTLGWRALSDAARRLAQEHGARTVATDGRAEAASLVYGLRDRPLAVRAWPHGGAAESQFDLSRPLDAAAPGPVLFVTTCASTARLAPHYRSVTPLGTFASPTGPTTRRGYAAYLLADPRTPLGPLAPCA